MITFTFPRSSSDESGAVKEFETTTISKLTNEVTTISRIVGKTDEKLDDRNKDIRKDSVSYTNNVIKISNLVRKDSVEKNPVQTLIYEDTVIRDSNVVTNTKDYTDKLHEVPPIMSQKSLDLLVDSLNTDLEDTVKKKTKTNEDDYEVIIKLPNGKQVRMRSVEEVTTKNTREDLPKTKEPNKMKAKEALKKVLTEKADAKNPIKRLNSVNYLPNGVPVTVGTLIPVITIVPNAVQKVPITPLKVNKTFDKRPVKRKVKTEKSDSASEEATSSNNCNNNNKEKKCVPKDLESRSAASRRYRYV